MTNDAVCILLCRQRSGQLDARASRAKPLRATRPESTLHGVGGTEIDNGAEVHDGREWYTFKRGETITSLLEQSGLDRVTLQKLNPHVNLSNVFPGDRIVIKGTANLRPDNHSTVAVVGSSAPQVVSSSTRTLVNLGSPLMLVLVCALTGASLVGKTRLATIIAGLKYSVGSQLADNNDEIEELRSCRDTAERELKELREKSQRNEQALVSLQQMLDSASRADAMLKDQIGILKESLDLKNRDIKRLEDSNEENRISTAQYKNELASTQAALNELKQTEQGTMQQLTEATENSKHYENEIAMYKEKLVDTEAELMSLRELSGQYSADAVTSKEKYKETLGEIERVKALNVNLETSLLKSNEQVTLNLGQIDSYKKDLQELELKAASTANQLADLTLNFDSANMRIRSLESELESNRLEVSCISEELVSVKSELEASNSELEFARGNLDSSENTAKIYKDELAAYQQKLDEAREALQTSRQEASDYCEDMTLVRAELEHAREEVESVRQELQASQSSHVTLSEDRNSLQTQVRVLEDELSSADRKSTSLSADLAATSSKLNIVQIALTESRDEATEYKEERDTSKQEAAELSNQLAGLQVKVAELEGAISSTNGESSSLSIEVAGLKSKLTIVQAALDQERSVASQNCDELAQARAALESELKEKESMEDKFSALCEDLSQQSMTASAEAQRLEGELAQARAALESELKEKESMEDKFSALCEDLSQQSMTASAEAQRLETEVDKLQSSLSDATGEISNQRSIIDQYRHELESAQMELGTLRQTGVTWDVDEYELKITSLQTELFNARQEAKKASDALVEEQIKSESMKEDFNKIVNGEEVDFYKSQLEITGSELETLKVKVAVNSREAEKYQTDLMNAEEKVSQLMEEIAELKTSSSRESESNRLSTESDISTEALAKLEGLVSEANERADRYKQRLLELEESMRLKLESVASIAEFSGSEPTEIAHLKNEILQLENERSRANQRLQDMQKEILVLKTTKVEVPQSPSREVGDNLQLSSSVLEAREATRLTLAQVNEAVQRMRQHALGGLMTHMISCEFRVRKDVAQHQFLVLVGSWHKWDLETAEYMTRSGDGSWQVSTSLFADEPHEYKYCVCEINDQGKRVPVEWQVGHNHGFAFDSALITRQRMQAKAQIRDKFFADPAHTPIILFGPNGEKYETGSTALLHELTHSVAEAGFENLRDSLERLNVVLSQLRT
jgi:chromosome segregation ATPase